MTTIQPRTSVVTIYQGDYLDRIRHLERQYEEALKTEGKTSRVMSDVPQSATLAEQHAALVAEAEESAISVTLRALGRKEWRSLVASHPPRQGNETDQAIGANEDTFKDSLVPVSVVEPEWIVDQLDTLSDVDFDRLYLTAFALNRAPASDPKALRVSPESQPSDATSN